MKLHPIDVKVMSIVGCAAFPLADGASGRLGPRSSWRCITYLVRNVDDPETAARLIDKSIILHSICSPDGNRFDLEASELGVGKIVHAGL